MLLRECCPTDSTGTAVLSENEAEDNGDGGTAGCDGECLSVEVADGMPYDAGTDLWTPSGDVYGAHERSTPCGYTGNAAPAAQLDWAPDTTIIGYEGIIKGIAVVSGTHSDDVPELPDTYPRRWACAGSTADRPDPAALEDSGSMP